ncbi:MAG: hypothetical protein WBV78_09575, partial [Roseobacter sp.]
PSRKLHTDRTASENKLLASQENLSHPPWAGKTTVWPWGLRTIAVFKALCGQVGSKRTKN